MKRLTSPDIWFYKIVYLVGSAAAFFGTISFFLQGAKEPAAGGFVLACVFFGLWWRYFRHVTTVFLSESGFRVESPSSTAKIPFSSIESARYVLFVRVPLMVLIYKDDAGVKREIIFVVLRSMLDELESKIREHKGVGPEYCL